MGLAPVVPVARAAISSDWVGLAAPAGRVFLARMAAAVDAAAVERADPVAVDAAAAERRLVVAVAEAAVVVVAEPGDAEAVPAVADPMAPHRSETAPDADAARSGRPAWFTRLPIRL